MSQSKGTRRAGSIEFHKMHGLGNDFMVIERLTQSVTLKPETIAQWGDRHTGIGFDQLLVIDAPTDPDVDFDFTIYNTDGSTAEQCGNGARAIALIVHLLKLSPKRTLTWQALAGRFSSEFTSPDQIAIEMTVPELELSAIPFEVDHAEPTHDGAASDIANGACAAVGEAVIDLPGRSRSYTLERDRSGEVVSRVLTPVSMGNPHGVLFVDDIVSTDVNGIGTALTDHSSFPERANIGFCQVIDRQFIRLRVFERGVGETRACGSGACAAVVAARLHGLVDERVKVSLPGGKLRITWPGPSSPVTMTGPARLTYTGEIPDAN